MKAKLLSVCDALKDVVNRRSVEYGLDLSSRLDELKSEIENYVFRIYVVGPFSCGKSSLLNRWMGENLLLTGLTPETAVSTELRYGETDRIELYTFSDPANVDETIQGALEESMVHIRERANRQDISRVVFYKNNLKLRECRDVCLVDMPGLSSNNPAHDAALKRFAQESQRVGIFCCQMGHFDETCLNFIKMMSSFGKLNVLLTQADAKPQSEHAECVAHVCGQIHEKIGREIECGVVSMESVDAFARMLASYCDQKDRYLLCRFRSEIKSLAREIESPLHCAVMTQLDSSEVEKSMAKLEEAEAAIPEMIRDAEDGMRASMRAAASDVVGRVRSAAIDQQSACAQGGQGAANQLKSIVEATISYAIPKVLQKAVKDTNAQADTFMEERFGTAELVEPESAEASTDIVQVENMPVAIPEPSEKKGGELLNWIGGLVTGNFTPMQFGLMAAGEMLLGPVGVFVGSAASFLLSWKMDEDNRGRQEAEYRQMVEQMVANARPVIEQSLQESCDKYLDGLRDAAKTRIGVLREQMLQLKSEAKMQADEWHARQQERKCDLEAVSRIVSDLEAMHG